MEKYKCCICGKEFTDWGNSPWPVSKSDADVCCDACNFMYVIPARLERLHKYETGELNKQGV